MFKDYECSCGNVTEYKKEYKVDFPKSIKCDKCGGNALPRFKKGSLPGITIPEHMRAALDFKY